MLTRGRFFFILDSFDEIPAVLDVNEGSWLIQHLSRLITEFFFSQDEGRGIVASRFYRRPKFGVGSATFEIRPFSDMRIHEALLRSGKLRTDTIDKLFRDRTELIPVARNPFSAALIRFYAENHGGELPSNQLEMYESYIRGRLDASAEPLGRNDLTVDQLIASATEIAWCMFREAEIGLEAPINKLARLLPNVRVEPVTEILRYASLARMSGSTTPRFSFVHRRLNEYFVARGLLNDPAGVTLQAIPTDSRYRDALALYCEVGEFEHVKDIAAFCWSEIANVQPDFATPVADRLRAVHCLRFLRDAFRTRPDAIQFVAELAQYIDGRLRPEGDLLAAKIALEATGLLPEDEAEPILVKAVQMGNGWISETALHACRHLKRIGAKLDGGLFSYLRSIPIREFLSREREIIFSLSLSDAFRSLRRYCVFRSVDNRLFVIIAIMAWVSFPSLAIGFGFTWLFFQGIGRSRLYKGVLPMILAPVSMARLCMGMSLLPLSWITWHLGVLPETKAHRVAHFLEPALLLHGSGRVYLAVAYLAMAFAVAPLVDMTFTLRRVEWRSMFSLERLKFAVPAVVLAVAVVVGLFKLLAYLIDPWMRKHGWILPIGLLSVTSLYVLSLAFRSAWMWPGDRRLMREVTRSTVLTRRSIAADFMRFQTHRFRIRYVEWLRDTQIQPVGDWIDSRPNVGNDAASTMLAQLDERWLTIET